VWFCLVAIMIAAYVVLDGFDLGAGAVHFLVAKTDAERQLVVRSIGPVWDGNEVWLLAAGGTLYFAFPALYASGFSGFYLPLMIVLWLLILRGIGIEFREKVASPVWVNFWDVVFAAASLLLAVFYGAALGNVVRGVPLNDKGYFFEALWTNFRLGTATGILDWYTILVGLVALSTLSLHGALWLALKTDGPVHDRSLTLARAAWWILLLFTILVTIVTFRVQPQVPSNLSAHPAGFVFPLLALAGLAGMGWSILRKDDLKGFLASCLYIVGMLTSVVFGLYPLILPARTNAAYSLTVYNAKAGEYGLRVGLAWWIVGMALVGAYFTYVYHHFAGKVKIEGGVNGY
ncbi:MAG TPA: cytochrome d ubiquinol oxidase subunit II, partial [Terriglobia bacterium]|nr:cytochrome d ubiquinol oxidase subunit II [Terriglobia bacterium]